MNNVCVCVGWGGWGGGVGGGVGGWGGWGGGEGGGETQINVFARHLLTAGCCKQFLQASPSLV